LGAAVGAFFAITAYFASRWRLVIVIACVTVVALLVYKVVAIGAWP
jgi:hypothetical protein